VLTNAPPSSGGILIAFALDLLERAPTQPTAGSADSLALLAEAMEEANRVRAGADFNRDLHDEGFAERFLSASTDRLESTTHISVLDSDGNAVSVTCSNGTGSGVLVPGTGIHLNNMLGEEDLNPLGYHTHEPGTRVTSMMAPTLVLKDGGIELT